MGQTSHEPSRKAFERGDLEDGLRTFMDGICGNRVSRQPPARVTGKNGIGEKTRASIAFALHDQFLRRLPTSSRLWKSAEIVPPDALGDGRAKLRECFFSSPPKLKRCLEGESQVMVPEAGHGMHNDNPTFYNQTVTAFLQRR